MIRTNLSTRPFYNERVVSLWLLLIFVIAAAATIFNTTRVLQYSHSDTEQGTSASRDESRTSELRRSAAKLRGTVDAKQIENASNQARQANDLIDRRTFSWTELFNVFEKTLPDDVRITAVRPNIDEGRFRLRIAVVARGVEDVNQFINRLQKTGMFLQVGSAISERFADDGSLVTDLEVEYQPPTGRAAGRERSSTGARR
jgi:Tfp pilus assembly protein PilN